MLPLPPRWALESNVTGMTMEVRGVLCLPGPVWCGVGATLTSQVIGSPRGDGERRGGAHGGCLLAIYRQHGKVLLGNQTYRVPLAVVQGRTWRGGGA